MTEMIERVARAIADIRDVYPDDDYKVARAAIEAMREPSGRTGMTKAGRRLIEAAKEAVAIARGEKEPARIQVPHGGMKLKSCPFCGTDDDVQ